MVEGDSGPSPAERFVIFDCAGEQCVAVFSPPAPVAGNGTSIGVIVVVGGPQYRIGSHRQFVTLARDLARAGIPVLRFDYRGMGDSDGEFRTFESIDEDICSAVTALMREGGVARVVLWGLCDGASAALMYASRDRRVAGIIAVNPWARTPQVEAQSRIRHYYLRRILSQQFWRKALALRLDMKRSRSELLHSIKAGSLASSEARDTEFLQRMRDGWRQFRGSLLFLLSADDYTAREFETWVASDAEIGRRFRDAQSDVCRIDDADHTFTTGSSRDVVLQATIAWVRKIEGRATESSEESARPARSTGA